MLATLMLVFTLNGGVQITNLLSPSMESCAMDARAAEAILHALGATDVYVNCQQ